VAELEENSGAQLQFSVRVDDGAEPGAALVRLSGDLDLAGADEARAAVDQAVAAGPATLTFDVTELRFMDSSGIAVLIAAAQKVDSVVLRNPSPVIQRLLTLAGLADVFVIET
jgi:anti-anti-sigma factor